jgi:hypothetical protein
MNLAKQAQPYTYSEAPQCHCAYSMRFFEHFALKKRINKAGSVSEALLNLP